MTISPTYVPSEGPEDADIVCVGEAPGRDEEQCTDPSPRPFWGRAGDKLMACLARNGKNRGDVFLTNLSKHRPEDNKFQGLLNSPQLEAGLKELHEELLRVRPTVIAALGAWPLYYLTGKCGWRNKKPNPGSGITNWRGSILPCTLPDLEETKVIPTFHPSYITRNASAYPIFDTDLKRIVSDATFKEFRYPKREYIINPSPDELEHYTKLILDSEEVSVDIETFGSRLACVGFAPTKDLGICIPFNGTSGHAWESIKRILLSDVPKIFHFGTFDTNYLFHYYGIDVVNWHWCTYLAQRAMWPELPKTLAYLTSVVTRDPYYKHEGKEVLSQDTKSWNPKSIELNQLWIYNCKDICNTKEVKDDQAEEFKTGPPEWRSTFNFDMDSCRECASTISRTGMLVDVERRGVLRKALYDKWAKDQEVLNSLVGAIYGDKIKMIPESDVPQFLNVGSSKQCIACLYDDLGFRPRRKKRSEGGEITTDEDTIVALIAEAKKEYDAKKRADAKEKWLRKLMICKLILIVRGLRKKIESYVEFEIGSDGRARSLYKLSPETGRWSAEKYVDGTGLNMQTLPRDKVEVEE